MQLNSSLSGVLVPGESSPTLQLVTPECRNMGAEALILSGPVPLCLHQNLILITSLLYLIFFPPKRPVYSAYRTVTSNHQQTSRVMVELHNTQPSLYSILSLEMPIKIKGMKIIFPAIRRYIIKTQGSKNNIAINNTW